MTTLLTFFLTPSVIILLGKKSYTYNQMISIINVSQITRQWPVLQHVLWNQTENMPSYLTNNYSLHVEHILMQGHEDGKKNIRANSHLFISTKQDKK